MKVENFRRLFAESRQGVLAAAALLAVLRAAGRLEPHRHAYSRRTLDKIKELWECFCSEQTQQLLAAAAAGDRALPGRAAWPLLEAALLYSTDYTLTLVNESSLSSREPLLSLAVLARLLGCARRTRPHRALWRTVQDAYQRTGRTAPAELLRVRWRQLLALARTPRAAAQPLLLYVAHMKPDDKMLLERMSWWPQEASSDSDDDDDYEAPLSVDFTELEACEDVDAINEYIRNNFFDEEALSIFKKEELLEYNLPDISKNYANDTLAALEKLDPTKLQVSVIVNDSEDVGDLKIDYNVTTSVNSENHIFSSNRISVADGRVKEESSISIDPKLLSITHVKLSRIDETIAWRKHARNSSIDVRRAGLLTDGDADQLQHKTNISVPDKRADHTTNMSRPNKRADHTTNISRPDKRADRFNDVNQSAKRMAILKNDFLESIKDKPKLVNCNNIDSNTFDGESEDKVDSGNSCYRNGAPNPDLYPKLKGLSKSFLGNEHNKRLFEVCKPVVVKLTDVEAPRRRLVKKVELVDIEEVRRINRTILTAQVTPVQSQEFIIKSPTGDDWLKRRLRQLENDILENSAKTDRYIRAQIASKVDTGYFYDMKRIIDIMINRIIRLKPRRKKKSPPDIEEEEQVPSDPYQEWERQKSIMKKYFFIGDTQENSNKKANKNKQKKDTAIVKNTAIAENTAIIEKTAIVENNAIVKNEMPPTVLARNCNDTFIVLPFTNEPKDILRAIHNTGNLIGLNNAPVNNVMPTIFSTVPIGDITNNEVTPIITGVCSLAHTEVIEDVNEPEVLLKPDNDIKARQERATDSGFNMMDNCIRETVKQEDIDARLEIIPTRVIGTKRHIPVAETPRGPPKRAAEASNDSVALMTLADLLSNRRSLITHKSDTRTENRPKPTSLPINKPRSHPQSTSETLTDPLQATSSPYKPNMLSQMLTRPPSPMTRRPITLETAPSIVKTQPQTLPPLLPKPPLPSQVNDVEDQRLTCAVVNLGPMDTSQPHWTDEHFVRSLADWEVDEDVRTAPPYAVLDPETLIVRTDPSKTKWVVAEEYIILTEMLVPCKRYPAYWRFETHGNKTSLCFVDTTENFDNSNDDDDTVLSNNDATENNVNRNELYNENNKFNTLDCERVKSITSEESSDKINVENDSESEATDSKHEQESFAQDKTERNPDVVKSSNRYFKKVCDDPPRYGLLLSAVQSAASCVCLLRAGAPLRALHERSCRGRELAVHRSNTAVALAHPDTELVRDLAQQVRDAMTRVE
ncbi:uncharacterized protein [Epargyreus clarus]|uniref:uncharacterized protein n=1 Tax=Epargyreus clarus TaxID=520877 RepID=UPI003C2D91E3